MVAGYNLTLMRRWDGPKTAPSLEGPMRELGAWVRNQGREAQHG